MGSITRSYRIRAYPNGAQRRLRDRWFGAHRWLWNTALEIRTEAYRECGLSLDGNDISRWLTQWKKTSGHEWLKLVPAEGFRQLGGRDDRDLCVDAGDACPEEILVQVLAEEARSGQRNRTWMEQARFC
ncbi:MAG TPA: helix-turn-helix domain-containing protein [Steroidobacteraceae bacterium]|jgi:hypothetical protein